MDIELVKRIIDDKIIWVDDPSDPILIEVVYEQGKYKRDPRTWYALYKFLDDFEHNYLKYERTDEGEDLIHRIPKPIIITLNHNTIQHYIDKFKKEGDKMTLIEMRDELSKYNSKGYREKISRHKKGPLIIEYDPKESSTSEGKFDEIGKNVYIGGPEKTAHVVVGHEAAHSEEWAVGQFSNYRKICDEEGAWTRAIPRLIRSENWDNDARDAAISALANYYHWGLTEMLKDLNYISDEWISHADILNEENKKYDELAKIASFDLAEEYIDTVVEYYGGEMEWKGDREWPLEGDIDERLMGKYNRIMMSLPEFNSSSGIIRSEDIFKFEGLPVGWVSEKINSPFKGAKINKQGFNEFVDQDHYYIVYDENGNKLSEAITEELAVSIAKGQNWNRIPWTAPTFMTEDQKYDVLDELDLGDDELRKA